MPTRLEALAAIAAGLVLLMILATFAAVALRADGQALKIGIIDFYGLNKVSPDEVRRLLTFKEGDTIALAGEVPAVFRSSEERLMQVRGVVRVRFEPVRSASSSSPCEISRCCGPSCAIHLTPPNGRWLRRSSHMPRTSNRSWMIWSGG
jgi:hypothetical protein